MKISTSFLACDDLKLCVSKLNLTDANYIHVDFIKGKFVTGKEIPFRKLKNIPKLTSKRLDVHLMTDKLDKYIPKFSYLNCEYITFHIEATSNVEKYIKLIHTYGIKCGIAINPNTDFKELIPYMDMIDLVLVMGVNPGYGGQEYIIDTNKKIKKIKDYVVKNKLDVVVSVDGGVNDQTISKISKYADMVVAGSFITNSSNYQEQINKLR